MSNKRLNEDTIVNELKDGSLFFQRDGTSAGEMKQQNRIRRPPKAALGIVGSQEHLEPPAPAPHVARTNQIDSHQRVNTDSNKISRPELPTENGDEIRGESQATESTSVRPYDIPPARTTVRIKRTFSRYAFEFFQDQIVMLKGFSLEEQLRGEKGNMSQMVREALDAYIAKRKRTED